MNQCRLKKKLSVATSSQFFLQSPSEVFGSFSETGVLMRRFHLEIVVPVVFVEVVFGWFCRVASAAPEFWSRDTYPFDVYQPGFHIVEDLKVFCNRKIKDLKQQSMTVLLQFYSFLDHEFQENERRGYSRQSNLNSAF